MALNSETTIKLVDLLCEGPIEGLVKNRHSVFLDETSAVDKEVKSIDFSFRAGTQSQAPFDDNFGDNVTAVIAVDTQIERNASSVLVSSFYPSARDN